jgi:hypothetical protein
MEFDSDTVAGMIYGTGGLLVLAIILMACHLCCDRSPEEEARFNASSDLEMAGIGVDPEEAGVLASHR